MRATQQSAVVHGVVGGLLAGAVVAIWFLVVDLLAGDPLRTPAQLGAALFEPGASRATLVILYTLLHFATFAVVGGGTGAFLAASGGTPGVLLGLFFGICVLNGVHYVGLLTTEQRLLTVLPWPHVFGANLLAGVAYMAYLHRAGREERPLGLGALRYHPLIAEGLTVGLVGAIAVALWFFVIDIATGQPLHTPAALGSAVFLGANGAQAVSTSPAIVAAYTVLHLVAFGLVGIGFAAVVREVEQFPSLAYVVVLGAILLEAITFAVLVTFGGWVLGALSLWAIGLGNLIAVAAMGAWMWRKHPRLRERVLEEGLASTP